MDRAIYFFLILTLISSTNFAQEEESNFVWGTRLGLNYSSFGGSGSDEYDVKTGVAIGVFTRLKMNDYFYFQPEFNYTSKGVTDRVEIDNYEYEFILAFTYLEVPFLAKFDFSSEAGDRFKPEIFAGPFGAMKINSELTLGEDRSGNAVEIDNVKSLDYGIVFGAGIGIGIDNVDLLFELRYTLSFQPYDISAQALDLKHRVFTLSTGFVIN